MKETKFKNTEIGMIPEEWEVKKLGTVFDIGNGRDYKHLNTGKIPVYGTGGLMTYVNEYLYDGETVCIGRKGTINMPQYHNGKIWTVDTLSYTYNFRKTDVKFLYYLAQIIDWNAYNTATGVPSLTSRNVSNILVSLPPLHEQHRIASALTSIDNLISSLGKLIEKKKNIKQGAMQQLLTGKTRLKGFNEPWVEKKLGEVCSVKRGVRVVKRNLTTDGLYPVYQNTNIPLGYSNQYNVEANTPFVIIGGSAGQVGICRERYWAADDCAFFACHDIYKEYLYYVLLLNQRNILHNVRTGTIPRLDRTFLSGMLVYISSNIAEQQAIATILTKMDDEITALEAKKAKYEAIKQGMMQQLLTGKIRLIS